MDKMRGCQAQSGMEAEAALSCTVHNWNSQQGFKMTQQLACRDGGRCGRRWCGWLEPLTPNRCSQIHGHEAQSDMRVTCAGSDKRASDRQVEGGGLGGGGSGRGRDLDGEGAGGHSLLRQAREDTSVYATVQLGQAQQRPLDWCIPCRICFCSAFPLQEPGTLNTMLPVA